MLPLVPIDAHTLHRILHSPNPNPNSAPGGNPNPNPAPGGSSLPNSGPQSPAPCTIWDVRRASLLRRLAAINARIHSICRSPASPAGHNFSNAHIAAHLGSLLDAPLRKAFLHRAARSMEAWDVLEDAIQGSVFISNMRALNYLWKPDAASAWGKVIQCVVFVLASNSGGASGGAGGGAGASPGISTLPLAMASVQESWTSLKRRLGGSGPQAQVCLCVPPGGGLYIYIYDIH